MNDGLTSTAKVRFDKIHASRGRCRKMSKIGKRQSLSDRVVALIEAAKQKVGVAVNLAQVYTNYEIGRQIVEEEQKGRRRAGYGEKIVEELSAKLTARFGRGWSVRSIETIRKFYLMYREIPQTVFAELGNPRRYRNERISHMWSTLMVEFPASPWAGRIICSLCESKTPLSERFTSARPRMAVGRSGTWTARFRHPCSSGWKWQRTRRKSVR